MTNFTPTRRTFFKGGLSAGVVFASTKVASAFETFTMGNSQTKNVDRIDQPLNQANMFDVMPSVNTAWERSFVNSGKLRL